MPQQPLPYSWLLTLNNAQLSEVETECLEANDIETLKITSRIKYQRAIAKLDAATVARKTWRGF